MQIFLDDCWVHKILAMIVRAGYQEMNHLYVYDPCVQRIFNVHRRSVPFKDKLKTFCIFEWKVVLYAIHIVNCEGWWSQVYMSRIVRAGGCPVVVAQWSEHRQLTRDLAPCNYQLSPPSISPHTWTINEPHCPKCILTASTRCSKAVWAIWHTHDILQAIYLKHLGLVGRRVACLEQLQQLLSCVVHGHVGDIQAHGVAVKKRRETGENGLDRSGAISRGGEDGRLHQDFQWRVEHQLWLLFSIQWRQIGLTCRTRRLIHVPCKVLGQYGSTWPETFRTIGSN